MASSTLDITAVRAAFPALADGYIFADNAGGSQCLSTVAGAISDYLLRANVQLGADYSVSVESTRRVATGAEAARELFNAESAQEVGFGSSSTQVAENLARAIEPDFQEGDEIVITTEHEANAGPWKKLAKRGGYTLKIWRPTPSTSENPYSFELKLDDLLPLITAKTRLVAFTACSNILGAFVPVAEVVRAVRARSAELGARKIEFSVDCVAYAPHRRIDVRAWDVEYAFFSYYKVYGPHTATLYTRRAALESSLTTNAHHFLSVSVPGSANAYKVHAPAGPCYELASSGPAIVDYLRGLAPERTVDAGFTAIGAHERTLMEPLFAFLEAPEQRARGVRIVGTGASHLAHRAPTVSFVVRGERPLASRAVVAQFDARGGVGIRFGHFYAYSLVKEMEEGGDVEDGVVRVSLVHYNTVEEVERIISILKEVLA